MNLNLYDKVFVISGSSRGIGKGIAEVLLAEGARIMLTGRDPASLSSTFDELHNKFSGRVLQCAGDLNKIEILKRVETLLYPNAYKAFLRNFLSNRKIAIFEYIALPCCT